MMSLQLPKEHAIISDNYKELYGQRTQPRVWIRQFWTGQGVIAMITRCCTNSCTSVNFESCPPWLNVYVNITWDMNGMCCFYVLK